mgnify:CR=1 FL=1
MFIAVLYLLYTLLVPSADDDPPVPQPSLCMHTERMIDGRCILVHRTYLPMLEYRATVD